MLVSQPPLSLATGLLGLLAVLHPNPGPVGAHFVLARQSTLREVASERGDFLPAHAKRVSLYMARS
jgi:hypothetical protein